MVQRKKSEQHGCVMIYIFDDTILEPEDIVELRLRDETCCLELGPEYDYFTELDILRLLVGIGVVEGSEPKIVNLSFDLTATEQLFNPLLPIEVHDYKMTCVERYETNNTITISYDMHLKNTK